MLNSEMFNFVVESGYGCMGGGKSMETGCDCVPQNWGA